MCYVMKIVRHKEQHHMFSLQTTPCLSYAKTTNLTGITSIFSSLLSSSSTHRMKFLRSHMQMLDMFVIVVSLILEILFRHVPEGGLLIMARSWRFARISHGIYESREDGHLEHLAEVLHEADGSGGALTKAYRALQREEREVGMGESGVDEGFELEPGVSNHAMLSLVRCVTRVGR